MNNQHQLVYSTGTTLAVASMINTYKKEHIFL
jgi:hypothetical protein